DAARLRREFSRYCGGGLNSVRRRQRSDFRRLFLVYKQMRVGKIGRFQFGAGDDDARAKLGQAIQPDGEIARQADAAMRWRVADMFSIVHGEGGRGDALHVGHRRIAVDVRAMKDLLLDDAEDAERRWMARHASGDGSVRNMDAIAVQVELLLID